MDLNNSSSSVIKTCLFLHPLANTETRPYVIFTCVMNALVFIPTMAGSTVILITMCRNPNLDSPNHIYLYSLAIADFTTGFVVQPCYILHKVAWLFGNETLSCITRVIMEVIAWISAAVSCTTVSLISFDRMLALRLHMRYQLYVTRLRAINCTLSIWISLTVISLTRFFMKDIRPFVIIGAIGILLGMVNVFFAYGQIFRYMRHHRKKISLQCPSVTPKNDNSTTMAMTVQIKALWKSAMNLAYVVGLFVVAYLPFVSTLIAFLVHGPTVQTDIAYDITRTIVFCASVLNPFFYCWKISDVRVEVMKTWNKISRRTQNLVIENSNNSNQIRVPPSITNNNISAEDVVDVSA